MVGVAGLFDIAVLLPKTPYFDGADGVASLAVALLVAAALWFVPMVRGSVDLSLADETIRILRPPALQDGEAAASPPAAAKTESPPPADPRA
ncbi:hypothetical protein [Pseudoxanthomonas sp. PXM01]|uniref:hypothetical protein n=1 Tax=Pseudoxanthomonas sp. PXM01 TaxID=2769295 RepID=UPI00177E8F86|nr:hypothetical protein [Pseudoxanthomonas sp. PXM01]MBD9470391.1 hypothetical protein [Pseudoxanthomonas sp. PXM01]